MINADKIHRVLANPVRRDILRWLKNPAAHFPDSSPLCPDGVSIGMIHARTNLSQSTVSAHLSTLLQAGLLEMRRVGQWVFVSRNEPNIRLFIDHLTEDLEDNALPGKVSSRL
jgi:DNA-binding transcriptional ArsR family regulator